MKLIFLYLVLCVLRTNATRRILTEEQKNEFNKALYTEDELKLLKYSNGSHGPILSSRIDDFNATDVKFYTYDHNSEKRQEIILKDPSPLKNTAFDPKLPVRVLIHGWKNSESSAVIQLLKKSYLTKNDTNIVAVDWGLIAAKGYFYVTAYLNDVAIVVADFLVKLIEVYNIDKNEIHLVGHSLGAHIAGLVGKNMQKRFYKLPVIFGLDPAGPLFNIHSNTDRLDKTDAEYVEVVHTSDLLGFEEPIGHVDFYANYGYSQPGCETDFMDSCSHSRAYEYFSIFMENYSDGFWGKKCEHEFSDIKDEKCSNEEILERFGGEFYNVTNKKPGVYYFSTTREKPFTTKGDSYILPLKLLKNYGVRHFPEIIQIICLTFIILFLY